MPTEHKYAQVWRWIADGKDVQFFSTLDKAWEPLAENTVVLCNAYLGVEFQFRLKPRTVKIGSREVEAPVLEPGDLKMVWCWDSDYNKPEEHYADSDVAEPQFKLGLCFATEEACQAAHDAIHAVLRGEA